MALEFDTACRSRAQASIQRILRKVTLISEEENWNEKTKEQKEKSDYKTQKTYNMFIFQLKRIPFMP